MCETLQTNPENFQGPVGCQMFLYYARTHSFFFFVCGTRMRFVSGTVTAVHARTIFRFIFFFLR